ncbi:MAG: hypothetical protein M3O62_04110 [Pseudomonadota bacterium]|nr:hypothetical protein [Pseudomonadota bacterium]
MATKKATVPNGSELPVPNRSELSRTAAAGVSNEGRWSAGTAAPMGRPPVLGDGDLDALAAELNGSLGRPPKLEELVVASGGCQRQRASRAIQRLRENLAAKSVQSTLVLPPIFEAELRRWMDRVMSMAATELAGEHARLISEHEHQGQADQELVHEQQIVIQDLRERLADQQRIGTELMAETQRLRVDKAQIAAELAIATALGDDRLRLFDKMAEAARAQRPT